MDYLTLEGGVKMPMVGYGVFQIDAKETERCVSDALAVGYRAIDTAQAYYNEEGVGAAVAKSGIPRDEIFLTTKVWISNAGDKKAAASIDESLRKLGTDYIDLLLIHQHYGDYYGTWRAMEDALKAGKVRAIGLSNFDPARITDLMLPITAWSPLAQSVDGFFTNPTLVSIAEAHGKTVAQVALRWLLQRGIAVIPKSTHRARMEENFQLFDFTLSEDDMKAIAGLNRTDAGTVPFDDPKFIKWLIETYS